MTDILRLSYPWIAFAGTRPQSAAWRREQSLPYLQKLDRIGSSAAQNIDAPPAHGVLR